MSLPEEYDKKHNCYHYEPGQGYGEHSRCDVYGYFRCHHPKDHERACKYHVRKDDTKKVEWIKMRGYAMDITGKIVEIEKALKTIKQFNNYIFDHI